MNFKRIKQSVQEQEAHNNALWRWVDAGLIKEIRLPAQTRRMIAEDVEKTKATRFKEFSQNAE
jgi:predicted site-specific integrase-resolvase